jgi:hypothetical protein
MRETVKELESNSTKLGRVSYLCNNGSNRGNSADLTNPEIPRNLVNNKF